MRSKKGTKVEVRQVPMFRRDFDDYEVGDEMWQSVMTHNCVVNLLKGDPLTEGEMSFIKIQNDHLKRIAKEKAGGK